MKKFYCLFAFMLFSAASASAQSDSTPYPQNTPNPIYADPQVQNAVKRSDDLNRRSDALKMTQNLPPSIPDSKRREFRDLIEPLYRESTDEEREFLKADDEDVQAHRLLAGKKDSGLFRLMADRGCADNTKVVDASAQCANLTMPGAGAGYSFRMGDYRMHHISDLVLKPGRVEALGVLNHGIMVDLGDVPIEQVTEKTEGVAYLTKIKPSKDFQQAADLAGKLTKGIMEGGRTYGSILPVRLNSTYVLRSIAYDGEVLRKVGPFTFNELELDKRRDILIAFRVVRLRDGRDATIVWKELDESKAPKLKAK